MNVISLLSEENKITDIHELLKINGSIRQIVIISAYLDLNIVEELIDYIENSYDERVYPILKIYTDCSSSGFFSNDVITKKYKELSIKINDFCSDDSGLFLVRFGKLFHSKCFVIQSNKYQKIIIGSLNFTRKGLNENEELILSGVSERNRKTNITKISNKIINEYTKELDVRSQKVTDGLIHKFSPLFLRHILLEGNIYYELKENDPFRFKLRLPKEIIDVDAQQIHPLLDGAIRDSISVVGLITQSKAQGGLGKKVPKKKGSNLSWKKYCVETCYGFWNPNFYTEEMNEVIDDRKNIRLPHYEKIVDILDKKKSSINDRFNNFVEELNLYILKNHPNSVWKVYENGKIFTNWATWYSNLENKIETQNTTID